MDWKHIVSVNVEDLSDDEKDELYNKIAWFNTETEQISNKKLSALFKVSQEILKYKGEQVETLLHELDELATKQGEEEANRKLESDTARSSRKSSSIEFENLEQKYSDLKTKYKKQLKQNERNVTEINKLNNKIGKLEMENKQMHDEIENKMHGESESDISEMARDQNKELMETIRTKNKQISDLLRDIEGVEKENSVLREKLGHLRDELANATKEITKMNENIQANDIKTQEFLENINKLEAKNDELLEQIHQMENEKENMEDQIREFSKEIENRIDEWKKLINDKDEEIERLKGHNGQIKERNTSTTSSVSSLPNDEYERSHINALSKVLNERETQLIDLQTQLQHATKDMEKNTEILKQMKLEKERNEQYIEQLEESVSEMKRQLKGSHERCQDLQDEVVFYEKIVANKETDMKNLLEKINNDGESDLSEYFKEIQKYKAQNRLQEKQIINLVKASNKLQDNCEQFEKENYVLREKLGLTENEYINLTSYNTKQRKYKKELENVRKELNNIEEEKLELRSEVQKLQKIISSLSDQILDLGQKPQCSYMSKIIKTDDFKTFNIDLKNLSEENEALRKGLHEILNSINERKEHSLTEIKSETFEKLLRALDVKHISGWYHPAMRLQAEIHNLEGVNMELREQLRLTKAKLEDQTLFETKLVSIKNDEEKNELVCEQEDVTEIDSGVIVEDFQPKLQKLVKQIKDEQLKHEFMLLQNKLDEFLNEKVNEKLCWEENFQRKISELDDLKVKYEINEEKLKIFTENQSDDSLLKKIEEIISLKIHLEKKVIFLKTEVDKLTKDIETLKNDFRTSEIHYKKDIDDLMLKNNNLTTNLKIANNTIETSVKPEIYNETKTNLDNLTIKYRELIENVKELNENKETELRLLHETNKLLENEKNELKNKLIEVLKKLHSENLVQSSDEKIIKLSKKLSESEVNEISERQRANHTNNLYELVKEQLQKSEERIKEFSKYNEEILHKNLLLQEQLKNVESKLCDSIDINLYRKLQNENNKLLTENGKLQTIINEQETKLNINVELENVQYQWNFSKEQELLNLKHQIVDLIADCDDKMQIALLHSDILNYRKLENEQKRKIENISKEFEKYKNQYSEILDKYEQDKIIREEKIVALQKKIELVQDLMLKQKLQYYGCVPLCSEEKFINKLKELCKEKHESFLHLNKAKRLEKESEILKEQCDIEVNNLMKQKQILAGDKEEFKNLLNWVQEKKVLQLNELRYRRQCEFKEIQMNLLLQRIQTQDEQIGKLEEELLMWHKNFSSSSPEIGEKQEMENILITQPPSPVIKLTKNEGIQTEEIILQYDEVDKSLPNMKIELITLRNELNNKELNIEQLKNQLTESEMNVNLFKKQLGDKQSQITFYERHILELQTKRDDPIPSSGPDGDNLTVGNNVETSTDETILLKDTIKSLQENLSNKDEQIREYQSLIKEDRDKHSLAAERLQEEIRNLQKSLSDEKQKHAEMEEFFNQSRPNMMTIDQYINQVHALEKHTAELHTNVTSLDAQLQSSRQEASRWREMANDRLEAMERLRENLETQHNNELEVYKTDSEKWRTEVNNLKDLISRHRSQTSGLGEDIKNLLKEKDYKIQELSNLLKQQKESVNVNNNSDSDSLKQDSFREILLKENETLKKRYEQLLQREKNERDEIKELKAQLLKKQISVVRADKSEKSIKEQLQKKVSILESEIDELKVKLNEQIAINDCHKVKISDDFDRWKKQKNFQQSMEKMKNKLKEKDIELDRLQNTCSGYRVLIERLEREKHNLENRIKSLKQSNVNTINLNEIEMLKMENVKLSSEIDNLTSKLKMQQHHAGGLGAAMLQEKLEAQERKIAILEVSSKGTLEVRSELERLQTSISTLQKRNLCLEAENLDLKLDLEKTSKELPYLREQIQHLENYIEVLKNEQNIKTDTEISEKTETKKVSELERTVFILKRVVEKLQTENKRLLNGKRPCSATLTRSMSTTSDKWKRDYQRLKEQYDDSLKKITELEQQLATKFTIKDKNIDTDNTLSQQSFDDNLKLKEQLEHKTQLLDKVKVLLHRAAVKEKSLLQEIAELKKDGNGTVEEVTSDAQ